MPDPSSLEELLTLYEDHWRARGRSLGEIPILRLALLRFFGHLRERGIMDVRAAREEDVVSFLTRLRGLPGRWGRLLAHATIAGSLGHVRGFFAFLIRRSLALQNPAADVHLSKEERLPRGVLSEEQARRLMEAPAPRTPTGLRDRALLEILYGSGLRAGECARLEITDVDLVAGTVFIRDGKGRKDRVVPLSACAIKALDAYLRRGRPALVGRRRESGLLISRLTGRRLTRAGSQQIVTMYGQQAGIPGSVHPHALRHTCATHLLKGGASVRQVQKILGHKYLRSTMLYTRVDTTDLRRVIEQSHPSERRERKKKRK